MADQNETRRRILVGEDDSEVRNYLGFTLRCSGYEPHLMADGEGVIDYLRGGGQASLVLLDIMMPNKDGWETLSDIQKMGIGVPVVMLSGMSTPPNVVEAIKNGAVNFLAKPVNHMDLCRVIEQSLKPRKDEAAQADPGAGPSLDKGMFVGNTPSMRSLNASLPKVAASDVPVLIQGETGTGKEVLARQLHVLSPRANRRFVKLNCAAIPSDLIESELFGHERGAYTGAIQKKLGLFELADQGTIFLDEIGDMDIRLQSRLLQVLQDQEFRRVGGTETLRVKVRVIAATNRDLMESVRTGAFREDLFYRLNIFTLTLPSLRERRQDIVEIANLMIRRHNSGDAPPPEITPGLKAAFLDFPWPGNIRQLENVVRKFLVLRDPQRIVDELKTLHQGSASPQLGPEIVPPSKQSHSTRPSVLTDVRRAKDEAEVRAILEALQRSNWNRKQAAALLNIEYKGLLYKMKKLAIEDRANQITLLA